MGLRRVLQRIRNTFHPLSWGRLFRAFFTGKISPLTFIRKFIYVLQKYRNNFEALMAIDKAHGVKATYFFGMNQGLGLSYLPHEAKPYIELVTSNGFEAGVHGIVYDDYDGMKREFDTWTNLMGKAPECIRMHYVRYDEKTFERLSQLGYVYDSTEFYKKERKTIRAPYKVGGMWEFPLTLMEGYIVPTDEVIDEVSAETLKKATLSIIDELKEKDIHYLVVLLHDPNYCWFYGGVYEWYQWLLDYVKESPELDFMSYREVIAHLEQESRS